MPKILCRNEAKKEPYSVQLELEIVSSNSTRTRENLIRPIPSLFGGEQFGAQKVACSALLIFSRVRIRSTTYSESINF